MNFLFVIDIYVFFLNLGNEARQFGIEDGSYSYAAVAAAPVYKTFTNFDGDLVQYVGQYKCLLVTLALAIYHIHCV